MTIPSAILGFLISTIIGVGFHVWRNGGAGRFLLYLLLGWIGFWAGHLLGVQFNLDFFSVGPLYLGMACIGSLLFLFVGHWLSLVEPGRRQN